MDSFEQALSQGNYRESANQIVSDILKEPSRMDELMDCFFDKNLRICHCASWPAGIIASQHPKLLVPYLKKMLIHIEQPPHDSAVRNTFRTLQFLDIPEEFEGHVFEIAFQYLINPQNAIAIRVFAMTVCGNIALKYPELRNELIPEIEDQYPHGSAGFKSRAKRVLKMLKQ